MSVFVPTYDLASKSVEIARTKIGVEEVPRGSNRGPDVDIFLREGGGLDPSKGAYAWCASFCSWAIIEAGKALGIQPQFKRSARALGLLEVNKSLVIDAPTENCIAVMDHGGGKGHAFFVTGVNGDNMNTLEGNSDALTGSRTGGSVVVRTRLASDCAGFIAIT